MTKITEAEMKKLGRQRYQSRVARAITRGRQTEVRGMQSLMRHCTRLVHDEILKQRQRWRKGYGPQKLGEILQTLIPMATAAITVKHCLNGVSQVRRLRDVACPLGEEACAEIMFRRWRRENRREWHNVVTRYRKTRYRSLRRLWIAKHRPHLEIRNEWSRSEQAKVGMLLIEMFVRRTGLLRRDVHHSVKNRGMKTSILVPTEEALAWIEEARSRVADRAVVLLPIHKRPLSWESMTDGGYHEIEGTPLLRSDGPALKIVEAGDTEVVRSCANYLQEVPWQVNDFTFEVAEKLWSKGQSVGHLACGREIPFEGDPYDLGRPGRFHHLNHRVHALLRRERRQRYHTINLMHRARLMRGAPFYYPMKVDFRGRLYPQAADLSIQGGDLARGLLEFGEPTVLGDAAPSLAHHGANTWGLSKRTLAERELWVENHTDDICRAAREPVDDLWWREADEPWQFLAFCREWERYQREGADLKTAVPCLADATNSALQIAALLLGDEHIGRLTNCVAGDEVADIYGMVAARVTARLGELPEGSPARAWLEVYDGEIPRSFVKIPMMIAIYGGSQKGIMDRMVEWQYETFPAHPAVAHSGWRSCGAAVSIIWDVLHEECARVFELVDWMRQVGRAFHVEHWPHFTAPTGFRVVLSYPSRGSKQTQVSTSTGEWRTALPTYGSKNDPQLVARAMPANFFHALDASCVMACALALRDLELRHVGFIHDCVAAPAPAMECVKREFRRAYAQIFQQDLVGKIVEEVGGDVPSPPERGSLRATDVFDSPYFIS